MHYIHQAESFTASFDGSLIINKEIQNEQMAIIVQYFRWCQYYSSQFMAKTTAEDLIKKT